MPGSSSSKGPSSKYSTWGHVESSTGGSDPFHPMMDMGSAFVCERGSSLRPFVACAARLADLPQEASQTEHRISSSELHRLERRRRRRQGFRPSRFFGGQGGLRRRVRSEFIIREHVGLAPDLLDDGARLAPARDRAILVEASTRAGRAFVFVS